MTNEQLFGYFLIAASSASTFLFAVKRLAMRPAILGGAFTEFAECVGAAIVFFGINELAGAAILFTIRGVWGFIGLYDLGSSTLIVFSLFQGFLFQMWWRRARG